MRIEIVDDITGLENAIPNLKFIETDQTVATVTAAGFLDQTRDAGFEFSDRDMAFVYTTDGLSNLYQVSIGAQGSITLIPIAVGGGHVQLPVAVNHIATFVDVVGVIGDLAAPAIHGGDIQAGLPGTAGTFISYPGAANTGNLSLFATAKGGNFNTFITNSASGAITTTFTLPSAGVASTLFITADSADVSGFQAINTNLAVNGGTVSIGNNTTAGRLLLSSGVVNQGVMDIFSTPSPAGNFNLLVTNDQLLQNTLITIPDPGQASAAVILSNNPLGQTIGGSLTIGGGLTLSSGNFSALASDFFGIVNIHSNPLNILGGGIVIGDGSLPGVFGIKMYAAGISTGSLSIVPTVNSFDALITLTNASFGQSSTLVIPNPHSASASFILSNGDPAGSQYIATGDFEVATGVLRVGDLTTTDGILDVRTGSAGQNVFVQIAPQAHVGAGFHGIVITNETDLDKTLDVRIPNLSVSRGNFMFGVTATPFVAGNFPENFGTQGEMHDSGIAVSNLQQKTQVKAALTANIGSAGAGPLFVSVPGLVVGSPVTATVNSSSNNCEVRIATAIADGFNVTLTADPGANLVVNYIAYFAAQ